MHLSFFQDDFKEVVDTLVVALRLIEKAESPIRHIHASLSEKATCLMKAAATSGSASRSGKT
jgi:tRNA(Phe) wybutosine-synthesizing methylase Tyw3